MLNVNELMDRRGELDGQPVEVFGLLTFEFENCSIQHFPKSEQRELSDAPAESYNPSSIWLNFGIGSIRPNEQVLSGWNGKRVRVAGMVRCAREPFGCGHLSGWDCAIEPFSIERV